MAGQYIRHIELVAAPRSMCYVLTRDVTTGGGCESRGRRLRGIRGRDIMATMTIVYSRWWGRGGVDGGTGQVYSVRVPCGQR